MLTLTLTCWHWQERFLMLPLKWTFPSSTLVSDLFLGKRSSSEYFSTNKQQQTNADREQIKTDCCIPALETHSLKNTFCQFSFLSIQLVLILKYLCIWYRIWQLNISTLNLQNVPDEPCSFCYEADSKPPTCMAGASCSWWVSHQLDIASRMLAR